jgi:Tfp pilus assembly protein PilF
MKRALFGLSVLAVTLGVAGCSRSVGSTALNAGIAAAQEDRWEEAARYWRSVLEKDPRSAAAHNNLAVALERQGAWDEAGREYETALRLDPENIEIKGNYESFGLRLEAARRKGP